ncbi:MAG TPA: glycosyltransferase family 4 protein [Pyrinomonadaceae bacterium]
MKILSFTAGAGLMYCGSCLRDNALAAELIRRGHDVLLMPIYTPTLTDEPNVSAGRVLFGGISVYLEQHSSIFRHTPRLLDKLWDSTPALKLATRRSIALDPRSLGELTVSMLRGRDGNQRKELDKLSDWLRHETARPDLVILPNSLLISLARPVKEATRRPLVCTLQGEDLFIDGLGEPHRGETLALMRACVADVDRFVAVSDYCAEFMARLLDIPEAKMSVVPLGVNVDDFPAAPRERDGTFAVGFFGRVAPEKGLHLLAEAYRIFRRRADTPESARLEAAGYLAPEHAGYLKSAERQMRDAGLAGEFRYHGSPERQGKIDFFRRLDVFSLPATYDEPKGLSVLEALASGVPAVLPRRGAFTEVIGRTGGGLLVEPDSAEALAEGIYRLWKEPELAADLGRAGARGAREHYSVARMADRALEVYEEVAFGKGRVGV